MLKSRNYLSFSLAFVILCLAPLLSSAQDTIMQVRQMKNTIKLNATAPLIYSKALQLGYERLIGENQSLNITCGYNAFPGDLRLKLNNTEFSRSGSKSGYMFAIDYRFYLQKEN